MIRTPSLANDNVAPHRAEHEASDKAITLLYTFVRKAAAASLDEKHKPCPGEKGYGLNVRRILTDKFQPDDQQHRPDVITDLYTIAMKEGADPCVTYGNLPTSWNV